MQHDKEKLQDALETHTRAVHLPVCQTIVRHDEIRPDQVPGEVGIDVEQGRWSASEARRTSHLCERVVENPQAPVGEIFRIELYRESTDSPRCFCVLYRRQCNDEGQIIITNQFITNDPNYAARHKWLSPYEHLPAWQWVRDRMMGMFLFFC